MFYLLDFFIIFFLSYLFTKGHSYISVSTFSHKVYPFYFVLIFAYFLISLPNRWGKKHQKMLGKIKLVIFCLVFLATVGKTFYTAIHLRHKVPDYPVHDNPIQIEEAIKHLLAGKNPYAQDFHDTPLEDWYKDNPAIYHVVTLPFYSLFSLLFFFPCKAVFGYFDQRMVHGVVFFACLGLLWKMVKPVREKIIYLSFFAFNPLFIHFFIEGRNDIFVFTWVFLSLYLLSKKKVLASSLFLGLAFSSKQPSWLILPFYFFYIFWQEKKSLSLLKKARLTFKKTWAFFAAIAFFFLPFLAWDAKSFIEDIYFYPGGGLTTSFPISGEGFSRFLLLLGINPKAYFPFWGFQLIFGLPILFYLLKSLYKNRKISFLILSYALFIFVFWLFSRFFMDNYIGYLSMLFLLARVFWGKETGWRVLL